MSKTQTTTAAAGSQDATGSACRFKIVGTTASGIRTFQGNAAVKPGQCAALSDLVIALLSGIVREEKLALLGITIEASMETPNAPASAATEDQR